MGYILIDRRKTKPDTWKDMSGIYEYPRKEDFGSLARLKRDNPYYDLKIVTRDYFNKHYKGVKNIVKAIKRR